MTIFLPSITGLSWFAELSIVSLPPLAMTHAQPLPKRPMAAFFSSSLSLSNPPNEELIASAIAPVGAPPALGPMICQNIEWFAWPPPLFRTAVRMAFGHGVDVFQQVFDALGLQFGRLLQRGIQIGDVRVVMLPVVDFHRLLVDVRLERVGRVGQSWKRKSHETSSSLSLNHVRIES